MNNNQRQTIKLFSQWLKNPDALVLDTESTGQTEQDEIIEISVIDMWGNPVIDQLVRPSRDISADATAVHGITNAMLEDAPTWPQIYSDIARTLSGRQIITYNALFDISVLGQTCNRYRQPLINADWHCAMVPYARFHGEWDERRGNFKWQRLTAAAEQLGLTVAGAHRALADCRTTLGIITVIGCMEGLTREVAHG